MRNRVIVGLSGGVDSSVAAYLLKEKGYEVIGLFMRNWHDESITINNECPWVEDSNDALLVANQLGIPFQTIDFSEPYRERIVDYMFSEYEKGRTPNPDVLCNREIKFDLFLETALKLDADYIATGHYCRKESISNDKRTIHRLLAGKDKNKDQSYFLCQLNQYQLGKTLFPIGDYTKPEIRKIARKIDLVTAEKKDSQGLCFIGKVRLPDFLQQKLLPRKGKIIEIPSGHFLFNDSDRLPENSNNHLIKISAPYHFSPDMGKIAGEHNGAHFFTIGQRKGLQIGGTPKPLFVIGTDTVKNIIYVGQGEDHPGLYRHGLFVENKNIHWVRNDLSLTPGQETDFDVRIRYRQSLSRATLVMREHGLFVIFHQKLKGVTPGQFVVWYQGEELIGSGVIE